ncbi:putative moz protein represents a chromatin-associated acetyltransferase [Rhypophila decipiens]|uniref:Moz protein represents a chromatin-associated acetyltransferase n=1 Tax=Rhypophila decipiens TaxID=261697 RepID=A0AAN7BBQ4_9PEZI|nr:putative moz protein represents a chromatin-associated acetyltransferase [Rhypophila decipiens]
MATTRLTFLYPHLFRTSRGRSGDSLLQFTFNPSRPKAVSRTTLPPCQRLAYFKATPVARRSAFARRAGTGVEPESREDVEAQNPQQPASEDKPAPEETSGKEQDVEPKANSESKPPPEAPSEAETITNSPSVSETTTSEEPASIPDPPKPATSPEKPPSPTPKRSEGPMETILHMGPPEEAKHKPPHLTPPPYIHHFDSYSLVKQLTAGSYTEGQAITAMKAVRGLLSTNLDVAQESLVSKSDVENETYLFRAACSELSTEVKNNRRVADEQMRQQRTHLQHEVDILNQRLNQELQTLTDNVRGMFNDRRMAVREEQKAADSKIQQINYKITGHLNSDMKSEIEALRWVLIRRSALGVVTLALISVGAINYSNYVKRQKAAEKKRAQQEAQNHDGKTDHSPAPAAAEILAAS